MRRNRQEFRVRPGSKEAGQNAIPSQALRDRTLAACQALFDAAGVPASPINTLAQVFADPQVIARGMVREVARPEGPPVRVIANPVRLSRTPPRSDRPPPRPGEHTDEVAAKRP